MKRVLYWILVVVGVSLSLCACNSKLLPGTDRPALRPQLPAPVVPGTVEQLTSSRLDTALEKAEALSRRYGASQVLTVFDLDNTLLKTDQDLGGEHWFEWQNSLLSDPVNPQRVACDFKDLLETQNRILSLSKMSPTEPRSATVIAELQRQGIAAIVLTSRGFADVVYTLRELLRNGIEFSRTAIAPREGFPAPYNPYDLNHPEAVGLSKQDVIRFDLKAPRPVTYLAGVYFTEGQHKGVMLRSLLQRTKASFKGIVFIDNMSRHTVRMAQAFENKGVDLASITYTGVDPMIQRFNDSDKQTATGDYKQFRKLLSGTFGYTRPCTLPIDRVAAPVGR